MAETLKFIKEGEFDEKLGTPTLRLVGEVAPVTVRDSTTTIVAHTAIFQEDILGKFLEQEKVDQPIQYIYAGLAQSRLWLPIFYYARLLEKSNRAVAELVEARKASQKGKKKTLIDRLERRRSAFAKTVTQASKRWAAEVAKGTITTPATVEDAALFCQGLTGVEKTSAKLDLLLSALRASKALAEAADDGNLMGLIFKAGCRVDELFFG